MESDRSIRSAINKIITSESKTSDTMTFVGSGEFSDVYIWRGMTIKINKLKSFYNPALYSVEEFNVVSGKELEGEFVTYERFKDIMGSLFPKFMRKFTTKHAGLKRVAIIREIGYPAKIVSEKESKKLIDGLVGLIKYGAFEDNIQIMQRQNGTIFISDLGHFYNREYFRDNWFTTAKTEDINSRIYDEKIFTSYLSGRIKTFCNTYNVPLYYPRSIVKMVIESEKVRKEEMVRFYADEYGMSEAKRLAELQGTHYERDYSKFL